MRVWQVVLRQSWASGGLGMLLAALILAVSATSTLRFSAAMLQDGVTQQSGQLLGADVVLSSSDPLRPVWQTRLAGLTQTPVLVFSSMAQANQQFVLVNVKAVSADYPLRGQLALSPRTLAAGQAPKQGTVWLEPRVMTLLQLRVGQTLTLGDAVLRVAGQIDRDPNRETGMSGFSPTVLINRADVAATHAVQVGSRLDYRLLLSGTPQQMRDVVQRWQGKLAVGERLQTASQGNTRLLKPIGLLNDYAQIANVMTLLLCGVAIALATQRVMQRQADSLALLRCLGASRRQLVWAYGAMFVGLWAVAVLIGAVLGVGGGFLLLRVFEQALVGLELPFSPLQVLSGPVWTAMQTAALLLLGFALPSLLQLLRVSPLKVLRHEHLPLSWSMGRILVLAVLTLWLFLWLSTANLGLSTVVVAALSGLLALAYSMVWGVLTLLKRRGIAVDGVARSPQNSSLNIVALGLGAGLVGVVLLLRGDLLHQWQDQLPENTPNQFVYGLAPDQKDAFAQALAQQGWPASTLYPMVKGRLLAHNGQPFSGEAAQDRSLERELNLSTSAVLPADNVIVSGGAFTGPKQVSVEAGLAKRLGLSVGDQLTMQLPEGDLVARIRSIRTVEWDRFSPNFFFIYSPNSLDVNAGSYLGSFYVPPADQPALAKLTQAFPTALFIDVGAILAEVKRLLGLLGQGLGLLATLVGLSGLLVLWASLSMMVDERKKDMAVLRALGVSRAQLRRHVLLHMVGLGVGAGLLAVVLAESLGAILAWRLDLPLTLHLSWWLFAPCAMTVLAVGLALRPLSQLWQQSPLQVLRGV